MVRGSAPSGSWRDRAVGLLRAAKRPLVAAGLGVAFDSHAARLLRRRLFRTRSSDVLAVIEAVEAAGVRCWLTGGWGVDALIGHQTRHHNDLDLCVDVTDDGEARALDALARLGYEVSADRAPSGVLFPVRAVCRDRAGRVIDLLLVVGPGGDATTAPDVPILEPGDVAIGRISGREVGCLAAAVQLQARTGYVPQARDRFDVERLCAHHELEPPPAYRGPRSAAPSLPARARHLRGLIVHLIAPTRSPTALLVPVPAAQAVVNACGGVGPGDPPAHVTVLYPFLPAGRLGRHHELELERLVASVPRFPFRLATMSSFPDSTYLEPDPPDAFVVLTGLVADRWPDFPPYEGAHDVVVPHVTLGDEVTPADLAPTVLPHLPIEAEATEVVLMARDRRGRWTSRWRFPLGAGTTP